MKRKKIVDKILRRLPVKFDHIVAAIKELKDLSIFTLHELMGSLEAHARTKNEQVYRSKYRASISIQTYNQKKESSKCGAKWQRSIEENSKGEIKKIGLLAKVKAGVDNQLKERVTSILNVFICKKSGYEYKNCRF